jgi:ankyrin repeat protein
VSADPGCGKSVLAKSLIDQELKLTESRTTCYFFFKDDNNKQQSVTSALSALLHQLFSQKPSLIQHAIREYKTEGNELAHSFHKMWYILTQATSDPKAGEVVCILDALDECAETGRYQIIDALCAFYNQPSTRRSSCRLKFLVTSRPYFDIERRFVDLTRNFPTIRLHGEKESEAISHEINIVIKSKVSELGWELELNESERSMLEYELLAMTHRTYLWLKLIVDVIRDEICVTKKTLKRVIGALPATVDQAYEAILSRVRNRDKKKVQKLLHIMIAATRPLTLKEMNIALAIEDHKCYDDLDLEQETRFESSVRNLCGLFVSIVDQKVYLIHQTAKEFLIAKSHVLSSGWKHCLDPEESELCMARTCITYLTFTTFGDGSCNELDGWPTDHHNFLAYAARFWAFHYQHAQTKGTEQLLQSVLNICETKSPRFQVWFHIYWDMVNSSVKIPQFTNTLMVGSYFGHETVVNLLTSTNEAGVNLRDRDGRTPLSYAAEGGHEGVVKLLLKSSADFVRPHVSLAMARLLLVNSKDTSDRTPLLYAARGGHEAVVKLLLTTDQAIVNPKDRSGRTPLLYAVMSGHEAVVKLLLATGQANVNLNDISGRTPLAYAAGSGNEVMVKLLLATGQADVNSGRGSGPTPLSSAAMSGHEAVVKLLLATGQADVNLKDGTGLTPLSSAAMSGHEAVVKLLLATDMVDVNSQSTWYSQTPLWWATRRGHEAVVKLLLATGKVDVDSKDNESGQTLLSWASREGHEAVVKLLLAMGKVDVDSKDYYGRTPLSWAAENGHDAVIELLLATGQADVNSKDSSGQTPLSFATQYRHEAVVKLLQSMSSSHLSLR